MKSIDKFVLVLVASLALLLAGCGGGSSTAPVDPGPTEEELAAERAQMQTAAIMTASTAVDTALAALSGSDPTQAQIDAVNTAISGLQAALDAAADVHDAAKAGYQAKVTSAQTTVMQAAAALMAVQDAAAEEAAAAMAATAAKLYAGIGATPLTGHAVTVDDTSGAWSVDPADVAPANLANQALTADEDTMVAANHGWEGMRHTASGDGVAGTYEAVVYSNVGEPTEGAMFSATYANNNSGITGVDDNTEHTIDTSSTDVQARIASPSFDQSAGTKTFMRGNNLRLAFSGSYHGVSGMYYCAPTATTCTATVAADGFTLGGGTWTFKADNGDDRLMETPDSIYASYGWWIHKSEDGETFTASAFAVNRGAVPAATGVTALQGTATYSGGAAGKYALHSTTGGTNDAGHFTADAMLEADFGDDMITGTIDNFVGADGESRDWSVELMEAAITDGGLISDGATTMTKWTVGGTAGDASGQWSGALYETGTDGVPSVGTGTFHSVFGRDGRMVGAFGVNVDD